MARTHLVIPDQHAHPDHSNIRADWLGKLIVDLKPDVVINLGDALDFASLSSYDKGKRSFQGKSYAKDLEAHLDFQDRMWHPTRKQKKKLPYRVIIEGNHEHRVEKALDLSPELQGTIGFYSLAFNDYYDDVVRYSGLYPGSIVVDGIHYSHYFVTGISGRPISGTHPAYSHLSKRFVSSTVGHSHLLDFDCRHTGTGNCLSALVAGCYVDYKSDWAGQSQDNWWSGVVFKRNVENGQYDPEFISLKQIRKEYGN